MTMTQLIYHSQPFGFDNAILDGILLQARRNNSRDDLTGALVVRGDLYLQLLEGPAAAVAACFARIARDDRHLAVKCVSERTITDRLFPRWTMRDDKVPSWLWTATEIADGAIEAATPEAMLAIFKRLP